MSGKPAETEFVTTGGKSNTTGKRGRPSGLYEMMFYVASRYIHKNPVSRLSEVKSKLVSDNFRVVNQCNIMRMVF